MSGTHATKLRPLRKNADAKSGRPLIELKSHQRCAREFTAVAGSSHRLIAGPLRHVGLRDSRAAGELALAQAATPVFDESASMGEEGAQVRTVTTRSSQSAASRTISSAVSQCRRPCPRRSWWGGMNARGRHSCRSAEGSVKSGSHNCAISNEAQEFALAPLQKAEHALADRRRHPRVLRRQVSTIGSGAGRCASPSAYGYWTSEDAKPRTAERLVPFLAILCTLDLEDLRDDDAPTHGGGGFDHACIHAHRDRATESFDPRQREPSGIAACLYSIVLCSARTDPWLPKSKSDAFRETWSCGRALMQLNSMVVGYELGRQDVDN